MVIDFARVRHRPRPKRMESPFYLSAIRLCPCVACDNDPARVAAHVRMSGPGKHITGIGIKPADIWTVPLCVDCHEEQHAVGEAHFWDKLGLDPLGICRRLANAGSVKAMREIIFKYRELRN